MPDMKIYTRTGDDGSTGLIGGQRVSKSHPRIECTGAVDELNAAVGVAAAGAEPSMAVALRAVQSDLFIIGSRLAVPPEGASQSLPTLTDASIERLERQIDLAEVELDPLGNFILPGGSETAARLHLARTICRRAERALVDFSAGQPVEAVILTYLNRLSDWLFIQARLANQLAGVADVPWVT